ncbi:MAG TPA: CHAD domain-containing protein [Rhodopila sp.]|jgi:CHAD domain-containing protein
MELELAADMEAVAGLARMKALTACRDGRPRSQAVKIVWHDSPDHALLADGLTLAEQRGVRRVERVYPGAETWLPAQPVPVVADPAELPSPLAPLAAFEGRQTASVHRFGDQSVTLTIAKGILRSVTAERPVVRIWLSGEEAAVREAAMLIAGAGVVAVPVASLAAEGIALATGGSVGRRHEGAPVLPDGSPSVVGALRHIMGHLVDVILAYAPLAARSDSEGVTAVHQMRVAVRRARSAVSIFRTAVGEGALDAVGDRLKDLGTRLGPTRDWDVFTEETIPVLLEALPDDERLQRLSAAASRRRVACRKELADYLDGPAFRLLGIELAWFVSSGGWDVPPAVVSEEVRAEPPTLVAFAGPVLQHRWKKLVSLGRRIEELDVPSLHGVRLRAKRARYATEMFATLHQGKAANRFIHRLSVLQQRLGVLNDGAVATHLLEELGGPSGRHAYAAGIVAGFMAARAAKIRPRIVQAFEKFRRQPAFWG